jgi:hypothetical protein
VDELARSVARRRSGLEAIQNRKEGASTRVCSALGAPRFSARAGVVFVGPNDECLVVRRAMPPAHIAGHFGRVTGHRGDRLEALILTQFTFAREN